MTNYFEHDEDRLFFLQLLSEVTELKEIYNCLITETQKLKEKNFLVSEIKFFKD